MGFKAIGKVIVTTAGTPVQAYASDPSDATKPVIRAASIVVAYPALKADGTANSGALYVGDKGLVKSTLVGVAYVLGVGDSVPINFYGERVNLEEIYLDCETSGAQALVSVVG